MRKREGVSGSYPLAQDIGGGGHLLGRSTAGTAPGSSFSCQRKTTSTYLGWPLVGLRLGFTGRRDGLERAQEREKRNSFPVYVFWF
jgi:hypothetical protein